MCCTYNPAFLLTHIHLPYQADWSNLWKGLLWPFECVREKTYTKRFANAKDPKFAFSGMLRQCVWFYNYNCTFWHAVDIPSLDGAAKPWPRLFFSYLLLLWCCVSLPWWKKTTYAWDINYQCCISGATYFSAWGSPVLGLFTSAQGLLITFHPHHYY